MKSKFRIKGLDCANCASGLERALNKIEGIENAVISFMTERLEIEYDENNNLLTYEKSNGYKETYTYDKNGNLICKENSNYTEIYEYDENNNVIYKKKRSKDTCYEEWNTYDER